ncbi:class I SAM-dependent methyltransferase [Fictibacillus aquaticus]|uniref:16S rRNA (Cytosine(1402)-N(4))-methyltransferase n=1 Tax=Fictibacillus aquaticus TaxID=2021314 RepID=A0A235FAF1_9BACL|nr:class I SAM-dependent methyltransferase [Fictibacillus aquaticus]OYD58276.1 16S rRNA (cytosine(1402)-N(4))-methyltransferase [Fictibacillus aquaticus]
MKLSGVLPFARELLAKAAGDGDAVVDATCGNGHDTLFLSRLVGSSGHVFAFDIQQDAIENAKKRLNEQSAASNVTFFHCSHSELQSVLPSSVFGKLTGAVFNLGYLPGGDKQITTTGNSTIDAVKQLLSWMKPGGIIVLVIYHGHEQGKTEKDKVMSFVSEIDQNAAHVLKYQFINQKNSPPFIIAIEKR